MKRAMAVKFASSLTRARRETRRRWLRPKPVGVQGRAAVRASTWVAGCVAWVKKAPGGATGVRA